MSGTERAALLLMTLGEKEAAEVLKYMEANEVHKLGTAMASLKSVSRNDADRILDVFILDVEDQTSLGVDTENYVRKLLGNARPEVVDRGTGLLKISLPVDLEDSCIVVLLQDDDAADQ